MQTLQRTFSIIKPDAVSKGATGDILHMMQEKGFRIIGMRMLEITKQQAEGFYAVHCERPFFESLTNFMSSGPIVVLALEAEGAILKWRDTMGVTDPAKAAPGTIRRDLGTSIGNNCTHGSDAPETEAFELGYFFAGYELL